MIKTRDSRKFVSQQQPTVETNSPIVPNWQSKINQLKALKMSKEQREKALNERFLIDGFLPVGYHIIVYGAAGSGKTSIVLKVLADMLEENQDISVFYMYIDGQLGMSSKFEDYLERATLDDRYTIMTNESVETMLALVEDMLMTHPHPDKLVFVLDTLKHLTPDLNNKGANAKAMHRIRKIVQKGATFLTLHHTNKDGENFSGTAEVEQDSDAVLKIETTDGAEEHQKISTIKEGGRVRFYFKQCSFQFTKGDPVSVTRLDDTVDVGGLTKMNEDKHLIGGIKAFLRLKGSSTRLELETAIKEDDDFDYSTRDIKNVISKYIDTHWKLRKTGERNTTHNYTIIE